MLALWLFPKRALQPMANLYGWSLQKFTSQPYGSVWALEADMCAERDQGLMEKDPQGKETVKMSHLSIRTSDPDASAMTAIPAVACILQMRDACSSSMVESTNKQSQQPPSLGLYRQWTFVEPQRFLTDLKRMGLEVSITNDSTSA